MIEGFTGDIWRFWPWCWIVIPTNAGYTKDGRNVMGAGLAQQALAKFPGIDTWYGNFCRQSHELGVEEGIRCDYVNGLITFVTKPIDIDRPHLSWKQKSSLDTIQLSASDLAGNAPYLVDGDGPICVPLVGCGNGGLDENDVLPILRKELADDRFILVRPND